MYTIKKKHTNKKIISTRFNFLVVVLRLKSYLTHDKFHNLNLSHVVSKTLSEFFLLEVQGYSH